MGCQTGIAGFCGFELRAETDFASGGREMSWGDPCPVFASATSTRQPQD
jgi:hypothetical protein